MLLSYRREDREAANFAWKSYMRLTRDEDVGIRGEEQGQEECGYYFLSCAWCSRLAFVKLNGNSDWAERAFTHL